MKMTLTAIVAGLAFLFVAAVNERDVRVGAPASSAFGPTDPGRSTRVHLTLEFLDGAESLAPTHVKLDRLDPSFRD